jgi:hypothetical protein
MERKILTVYDDSKIVGDFLILARGLLERLLDSGKNNFATDAALCFDMLNNCQQLTVHSHFLSVLPVKNQ